MTRSAPACGPMPCARRWPITFATRSDGCRRSRAATTITARWHSRCATGCRIAGRDTTQTYFDQDRKIACYLSAEFLLGPHLGNNLVNLDLEQAARTAMTDLGQDLDVILACEEEPGLGNGGLGRLAACYLDSLATLQRPAIGYGIRYEFGIFDQEIRDGWQVEVTDKWLRYGNPWEIAKPEVAYYVNWGGRTEWYRDNDGRDRVRWVPNRVVKGTAYDTPIQGYRVTNCNTLRLWSAEAVESFDFQAFNVGDYYRAVDEKLVSETVTKVLYPNDEPEIGKRLRLAQQYFFVSCSLQDMLHTLDAAGVPVTQFAERFAVQLNDTHPSIGVAELMRLLVDERRIDWETAWRITVDTFGYTNHTLLPEALETWPLADVRRTAAATHGDHPRDQPALPRRGARAVPGRRCTRKTAVADRRRRRQVRAHGASRDRRQPCRQRRRGPAFRAAQGERPEGLLRALAGALQQQDQRGDTATFPRALESGAPRAAQSDDRRRVAGESGIVAEARAVCGRRGVPPRVARDQTGEQASVWRPTSERTRASSSIPNGCSTSRSSASTNTSAST